MVARRRKGLRNCPRGCHEYRMATIIDPILTSVALLLQVSGTNLVGSATGFFFQVETNKYLVSNRHVFTGEALPPTGSRPGPIVLPPPPPPTNTPNKRLF